MIQILPVTEEKLLAKLNRTYNEQAQFAFVYIEKREIKASCLYDIKDKTCIIRNLSTVEDEIFDGLVRAVFAAARDKKTPYGSYAAGVDRTMLERLNLAPKDRGKFPLQDLFHNCGEC